MIALAKISALEEKNRMLTEENRVGGNIYKSLIIYL
jgi:hypothetical protein